MPFKACINTACNSILKIILKDVLKWDEAIISTHSLRNTFATRCIESGAKAVVLQRLLGHTDGILKGKSSIINFQRWSNLKYKFGQQNFWCRGYYIDTVGKNEKTIAEYVKSQLKKDMM